MNTEQLQDLDRRYVWHPFTHMSLWLADDPIVLTGGDGVYVIDSDGRRYIDGTGSLWCNVHGHRVPQIDAAIRAQLDKIAHSTLLGYAGEPSILLAEKLIRIAPPGLAKVFYSDSGATATEVAFKMAVQYWWNLGRPEKCEFIGITEGYHGDTAGGMSVGTSSAFHKPYRPLMFKTHYAATQNVAAETAFFPPALEGRGKGPRGSGGGEPAWSSHEPRPGTAETPALTSPSEGEGQGFAAHRLQVNLDNIEAILIKHASTIAAIAIEPLVMGAAGMLVHPPGFTRGVRELADKYDVLFIADEVATGFGRTGRMFACEHDGVTPDLLCLGKGLTGGYLPVAATLTTQKIFDAFLGEPHEGKTFFHGHTFTGNALGCAAAIASIDLMEATHLVRQVAEYAPAFALLLEPLKDLPCVGEIRQAGFMIGIDLVAERAEHSQPSRPFDPRKRVGADICRRLRRHGVLLRPLGDTIVINPPLTITPAQFAEIATALKIELSGLARAAGVGQRGDAVIAGDF